MNKSSLKVVKNDLKPFEVLAVVWIIIAAFTVTAASAFMLTALWMVWPPIPFILVAALLGLYVIARYTNIGSTIYRRML